MGTSVKEAKVFWLGLSCANRLKLAKTAAGPWRKLVIPGFEEEWRRELVNGSISVYEAENWDGWIDGGYICGAQSSVGEAKAVCDAKLRDLGYLLED